MRLRWLAIFLGLALMAWAAAASYARADGVRSTPDITSWTFATPAQIKPSARTLTVGYYAGGCVALDHVDVQRDDHAITIGVYVTSAQSTDGYALPCVPPMPTSTTVDLKGRIGHRMVADAAGHDVAGDYLYLRHFARRVTFDRRISLGWLPSGFKVASFTHAAHDTVLAHLVPQIVPLPSPAVPQPTPSYTMPDFRGRPLTAAAAWAGARGLQWTTGHTPRLVHATRKRLVANYVVTKQTPAPGSTIGIEGFVGEVVTYTVRLR